MRIVSILHYGKILRSLGVSGHGLVRRISGMGRRGEVKLGRRIERSTSVLGIPACIGAFVCLKKLVWGVDGV
jgi:hypothetical protein